MNLSLSLTEEDLRFIDRYASEHGMASRSAVVKRAVALLRGWSLGDDYEAAWTDWSDGDAEAWEPTAGDGIEP